MHRRSPQPTSRSSRDRHNREKEDRSKKSSNLKAMEEAKRKMREGLESASKTSYDVPGSIAHFENLSHSEQASRAREIERIEEGGFQPAQFKSSMGGGKQQKNEKLGAAQSEHEKAIFGPAWMSKEMKKEDSGIPLPPSLTASTKVEQSLLNEKFLADPEKRKHEWLQLWRQQRHVLGIN